MKKITSIIISFVLLFSFISVSAQTPAFLSEAYNNYTGDYSLSIDFENSEDIVALIEEIEFDEEIYNYIDLKALITSLLSLDSKMLLQADMSDDFSKIELSMTSASESTIDVNKNLNIGVNAKTGMWIKIDLDAIDPVFDVIYSYPYLNKYMHINIFEAPMDEDEKRDMLTMLRIIFSEDFIREMQNFSSSLLTKYAQIKISGLKWVVKIDNDALISMTEEIMIYIFDLMSEISNTASIEFISTADTTPNPEEMPSLRGLKLLGDEGITYTYSLSSGKISSINVDADICIDISSLFTNVLDEPWFYDAKGLLDFKIKSDAKISKIGSTNVDFPALTEENSFSPLDALTSPTYPEPVPAEEFYPNPYFYNEAENIPVINSLPYVPLRQTIESAYGHTAAVEYNNGTITVKGDHLPWFNELLLNIGSGTVYFDSAPYETETVIAENGTTYVSAKFFVDFFGWELTSADYNMLYDYYTYSFFTEY